MIAQSREKIALVVFFCLILLGAGGLVGYLFLGHSWNVAATNIDDVTGTMDNYTTILYEGTVLPTAQDATSPETEVDPLDPNPDTSADSSGIADGESGSSSPLASDDTLSPPSPLTDTSDEREAVDDLTQGGTDETERSDQSDGSAITTDQEGTASSALPGIGATTGSSKRVIPIDIEDVEEDYTEKEATVFTLDTLDIDRYYDGLILRKGDKRFGVFSTRVTDTPFRIERQVNNFKKHEVDLVIVLTPDSTLVQSVSGIDIVISTQQEDLFVMGETINGTFHVSTPTVGSVGAILISPNNVVSAKVFSSQ